MKEAPNHYYQIITNKMNNQTKIGGYAIKGVQLIQAGRGYSKEFRASYNRYRVLVQIEDGEQARVIEDIYSPEELKKLPYWSNRSQVMAMTCWGTSQEFEAQLALASFFNMKRDGEEWGDYTRRVKALIKSV